MTREEFDQYNEKISKIIFGPSESDYENGEFFKVWRYQGLRDVKDNCPNRAARNLIRKWHNERHARLWNELGFPPVPEGWNYWNADQETAVQDS
jgi:hypothetical protein